MSCIANPYEYHKAIGHLMNIASAFSTRLMSAAEGFNRATPVGIELSTSLSAPISR